MAGRYERINTHDAVESDVPTGPHATGLHRSPRSPPPSFHSRPSSLRPGQRVDPNLADAFDAAEDSDDEDTGDDTQRLVRGGPSSPDTHQGSGPLPPRRPTPQAGANGVASRVYGGGIQSDGVFSNLTAKPERPNGEKEEQPPTYEQAAADAVPPYWETTILAPGFGGLDDVYIDGMPVGSLFSFVWNGMISMSFQLVGFLLTYLLHSTHAAKNGSRAGLGITLIQYGFYMKASAAGGGVGSGGPGTAAAAAVMTAGHGPGEGYADPPDPNAHDFDPASVGREGSGGSGIADLGSSAWVAYILMIVGWFILIRAVSDYLKARRHEQLVRQSPDRGLGIPIIAEDEAVETVV